MLLAIGAVPITQIDVSAYARCGALWNTSREIFARVDLAHRDRAR